MQEQYLTLTTAEEKYYKFEEVWLCIFLSQVSSKNKRPYTEYYMDKDCLSDGCCLLNIYVPIIVDVHFIL